MLLFISWAFLKYVDLPVHTISVDATRQITPNQPITTYTQTETNVTLTLEASLAVYIIAIMSFIGWIFVFLFAGVGLFALPIDLINEFRHRPKARKSEDIKTSKNRLTEAIKSLLQEGETLKKKDE